MNFECAVSIKGVRCEEEEPGDTIYLGALTFCREHQEVFEGLVEAGDLGREIRAAKLNKLFHVPGAVEASREVAKSLRNKRASVYFIRCGGYVKIGASRSPTERFESIRTFGGVLAPPLLDLSGANLIATEPGGFKREKELHAKFKHLRSTGEWFIETPELTAYIEAPKSRKAPRAHAV